MKKFLLALYIIVQAASAFGSDCTALVVWQEQKDLYELWLDLEDRQDQEKKEREKKEELVKQIIELNNENKVLQEEIKTLDQRKKALKSNLPLQKRDIRKQCQDQLKEHQTKTIESTIREINEMNLSCQIKSQELRNGIDKALKTKELKNAHFDFEVLKKIAFPKNELGYSAHTKAIKKFKQIFEKK